MSVVPVFQSHVEFGGSRKMLEGSLVLSAIKESPSPFTFRHNYNLLNKWRSLRETKSGSSLFLRTFLTFVLRFSCPALS